MSRRLPTSLWDRWYSALPLRNQGERFLSECIPQDVPARAVNSKHGGEVLKEGHREGGT